MPDSAKKSILLVDDDPSNLFLLEALLQSQGYSTWSVSSGAEALEKVQSTHPDLILLDVMMPEMDGFEVCRRLRLDPRFVNVPVIFLTALDDDDSRLRGMELMGDDYFTKPINNNLLLAKVNSSLRLSQMRSQQSQQQLHEQVQENTNRQLSTAWQVNEDLSEKFRLFVPEQFLQRIAPEGVESIQLGNAKEEEITILFCDIRGFTTIAEFQLPSETFEWLNIFFTEMNQAIAAHHGFIDKFLGDAIMAVFDRTGHHAQDALSAAVDMQQQLSDFNRNYLRYNLEQPISIGIGIHTGRGLIGTLGSAERMDSTVIGDVVNTASRLEELTKVYGCPILVSDRTVAQLSQMESFYIRWIDRTAPRGKQQVNDLYELLGTQTTILDRAKVLAQSAFDAGIQGWKQGQYATALKTFQQVIEQNPTDAVAALYLERCQAQLGGTTIGETTN